MLRFNLASSCPVNAVWNVYSVSYKRVAGSVLPVDGSVTASWDLKDENGVPVATGVYYLRVVTASNPVVQKILVRR